MKFLAEYGWFLFWVCLITWICSVALEYRSHTKAITDAPDRKSRSLAVFKASVFILAGLTGILSSLSSQIGSDLTEEKLAPVKLTCIDTNVAMAHEKGWEARLTFQNIEMEKALNSFSVHAEADDAVIAEITIGNATSFMHDNGGSHDPSLKVMNAKAILANPGNCNVMIRVKKPTTVRLTSPNFEGEKVIAIR